MFYRASAGAGNRRADKGRGAAGQAFSVLGQDAVLRGDVAASGDIHLDGRVEGDVACAGLVQGETGVIVGALTAETARIAGTIEGSVSVRALVILRTARLTGDVAYEALTIEQGALVEGRLMPRGHPAAADLPTEGTPPPAPRKTGSKPELAVAG